VSESPPVGRHLRPDATTIGWSIDIASSKITP